MKTKERERNDRGRAGGAAPSPAASPHPRAAGIRTRARRRRAAGPPRDFPPEPENVTCPDDVRRIVFTNIKVPTLCEEKACRRSLRCIGTVPLRDGGYGIACWERHRDVLQPFWTHYVIPKIRALPCPNEESDN